MASKKETKAKIPSNMISVTDRLVDQMFSLCMSKAGSDVEFVVEEERIPAHRIILSTRSPYFRSLLFSGLSETHERIVPLPVKLKPFKAILIYLYTGQLQFSLGDGEAADIFDVLELAHQYMIQDLISAISDFICPRLNLENICINLNAATTYSLMRILNECFKFIDRSALHIVKHDSIESLTKEALIKLITYNGLSVEEIDIFRMVLRWSEKNPNENIEPIIENVRFPLMKLEELVSDVQKSGILEPKMLLKYITEKALSTTLPHRSLKANPFLHYINITCLCEINASQNIAGNPLTFKMSQMCLVNTIAIHFVPYCEHNNGYNNNYSFYVEVSTNSQNWIKISERSTPFNGCNVEKFDFAAMQVFYIRVKSTNSKQMKITEISATYISK